MIRCLNNELNEQARRTDKEYYKSLKQNNVDYGDGRLDTVDDEDDFDMERDMMEDDEGEEKIEVDIDIQRDEEEEIDIAKRFMVHICLICHFSHLIYIDARR